MWALGCVELCVSGGELKAITDLMFTCWASICWHPSLVTILKELYDMIRVQHFKHERLHILGKVEKICEESGICTPSWHHHFFFMDNHGMRRAGISPVMEWTQWKQVAPIWHFNGSWKQLRRGQILKFWPQQDYWHSEMVKKWQNLFKWVIKWSWKQET